MSLGYSVTELIAAGKYALDLCRACQSASDVFQEAAQQCLSIYVAIGQTQRCLPKTTAEADSASHGHETTNKLSAITFGCRASLKKLEEVVRKYKSLGSAAPTIWDSFRFGAKGIKDDLADIRSELGLHLITLSVFITSLQEETLGEIKQSLVRLEKREYDNFAGASNVQHESNPALPAGKMISELAKHQGSSTDALGPTPQERREQDEYIRSAIEDKRILLEAKLSTYENLRASVMLCSAADQENVKISERSFRYSREEEWLSRLPEGWQRIMVSQNEYQYRYLLGTKQIRSRVYDLERPFESILEVQSNTLPEGWTESTGSGRRKHFSNSAKGLAQLERPVTKVKNTTKEHYIGWVSCTGLPIDVDDICSVELALALYIHQEAPFEDIQKSLPNGWQYLLDANGRPLYIFSFPGQRSWKSTVHPAFFTSKDLSGRLPPGWEYRLDNWGIVFYVNHSTNSAQSLHPQMDKTIDFGTGLPLGWEEIADHNGIKYFFERATLLATYQGSSVSSNERDHMFILQHIPRRGEIPPIEESVVFSMK